MIKVLLADDEWIIREGLKQSIAWENYGLQLIGAASNGIEAIEMVKLERTDILITDIRMPGVSGLELIELVQKENPNIKTIILTGYSEFSYAQQAIKLGINDFLLKPVREEELEAIVKKLVTQIKKEEMEKEETTKLHLMNFIKGRMETPSNSIIQLVKNWTNFAIVCWEGVGIDSTHLHHQLDSLDLFHSYQISANNSGGEYIFYSIGNQERMITEVNTLFEKMKLFGGCSEVQDEVGLLQTMYKQAEIAINRSKNEKHYGCMFFDTQASLFNIDHVLDYIQQNYRESISLQEIAAKLFISDSYFSRMFKQYTGKKFIDYLTEIRVNKAKELLIHTPLKTNEISRLVGYNDQRYFSQIFKKMTNFTPTEYKQKYKKN